MIPQIPPLRAMLTISGWHGTTSTCVLVVGSTPKRYVVRALGPTKLVGRNRWLAFGEEASVPRSAVRVMPGAARWEEVERALAVEPRRPATHEEAEQLKRAAKGGAP